MQELDKKTRLNLDQARVLLLESPQPGADILAQVFYGYGVRQPVRCTTPDEAMGRLEGDPFELIVVDGDLPDGGAYDFIMRLRRSPLEPNRYCPVILLTAHTPHAYIEKARDCGANFVVAKPIRPMVLLERMVWCAATRASSSSSTPMSGPIAASSSSGRPRAWRAGARATARRLARRRRPTSARTRSTVRS